jgi:acetyltransferase-like isoleucine patch superfamily enzyme
VFIDSQTVIRFSILDDGVRVGPFAAIAEGPIAGGNGGLPTRRGSVIGADVQIGARSTVKPGSILGAESFVGDGIVVGELEAGAKRV